MAIEVGEAIDRSREEFVDVDGWFTSRQTDGRTTGDVVFQMPMCQRCDATDPFKLGFRYS